MLSSDKKRKSGKQRNSKIRESESIKEQDEGNNKSRKKYIEHVLGTMPGSLQVYLWKVALLK